MITRHKSNLIFVNAIRQKKIIRENIVKWLLIIFVLLWFFILILFPLGGIIKETVKNGLATFVTSISSPASLHSFLLTFIITVIAVIINTLLGVILAIVFSRYNFKGKLLLESLIDLPFAVSPVVAGFMFIILFGPGGWIGSWFESVNIKIIYALPGMIIATLFVTFPFVVREILPTLREFGREPEEAAATLGADGWQSFWLVTLPSIKWGLTYGITLTIARSIGEFGAVLVVSGAIINKTQTATLHIHHQFSDLNYAGAFSAALVLAIFSFAILTLIQYIYKKRGSNNLESLSVKSFSGRSRGAVFSKRGRRPHPIHGQSDAVLSGAPVQKLVFFACFFKILIKTAPLATGC
jgi:sulfate transport system permease protein